MKRLEGYWLQVELGDGAAFARPPAHEGWHAAIYVRFFNTQILVFCDEWGYEDAW